MTHPVIVLGLSAILAVGLPAAGAAQGGAFTVDPSLAAAGKKLFVKHGCGGCHGFGRTNAGPDLKGIEQRRSTEWIHKWMKNTTAMLTTDSIAAQMLRDAKGVKMPQMKVSDSDIDALIHYMAQEGAKVKSK